MKKFIEALSSGFKNWQTTALGGAFGASSLLSDLDKLTHGTPAEKAHTILTAIGMILMGIFAKDADKTGVLGKK